MELIQFKGPFYPSKPIIVEGNPDYTYVHIGIQIPKSQPIVGPKTIVENGTSVKTDQWLGLSKLTPSVRINADNETADGPHRFKINASGILEFDGLSEVSWTIRFSEVLPPECIIDIIRKNQEVENGKR